MKITNQNSHTHTLTEERKKKAVWQGHHNSFRQLHVGPQLTSPVADEGLPVPPYGGTGREAERFMTEKAQKLAERKNMTSNTIIHWLRSKLSFNLLKSAVMCLRGSRRSKSDLNMDLNIF